MAKRAEPHPNGTVFRVVKTKNYTIMSNYHLRDTELSLKAMRLRNNFEMCAKEIVRKEICFC